MWFFRLTICHLFLFAGFSSKKRFLMHCSNWKRVLYALPFEEVTKAKSPDTLCFGKNISVIYCLRCSGVRGLPVPTHFFVLLIWWLSLTSLYVAAVESLLSRCLSRFRVSCTRLASSTTRSGERNAVSKEKEAENLQESAVVQRRHVGFNCPAKQCHACYASVVVSSRRRRCARHLSSLCYTYQFRKKYVAFLIVQPDFDYRTRACAFTQRRVSSTRFPPVIPMFVLVLFPIGTVTPTHSRITHSEIRKQSRFNGETSACCKHACSSRSDLCIFLEASFESS